MSSLSGPIAGFSLATRVSNSSSRRCSGGSGSGPRPGKLLAEAVEQALGVVPPEVHLQAGQRGGHRAGLAFRLVALDEQVADLVQQPQRADVTGLDRRLVQRTGTVHPARQAAHAGQVGDDQIAADPEQRAADAVSLARLAPDVEVAHQRSIARRPPGDRVPRLASRPQAGVTSVGRLAVTCSMARRNSSRPDGSKS